MVKFKDQGFEADIPKELEKFLRDNKVTGDVITAAQLDEAVEAKTPTGLPAKQLEALEKQFADHLAKQSAEAKKAAEEKAAAPKEPVEKAGDDKIQTTSYFTQTDEEREAAQLKEQQATTNTTKPKKVLTKAERQEAAAKRDLERQKEIQAQKAANQQISDIDSHFSDIEFAEEVDNILKENLLINNTLPLYRTFVSNDTKVRPMYEDTIDPEKRQYDDDFREEGLTKPKGHTVPLAKSKAQYKMYWVESIPPQPKGYFIFVPKWLYILDPANLQFRNHRAAIVKAHAAKTPENSELVIKYIEKAPMLSLLVSLETSLKIYNDTLHEFEVDSPTIYPKRLNSESLVASYALRARDSSGAATKLSIRKFLPEKTHVVGTTDTIDLVQLTTAYFNKSLFSKPVNHTRTKYDKLISTFQEQFTQTKNNEWLYTNFNSPMNVKTYDSSNSLPVYHEMDLPQVGLNQAKTAITFVTAKADESGSGYSSVYRPELDKVGAEFLVAKNSRSTSRKLSNVEDKRAQMQTKFDLYGGMEAAKLAKNS